MKRGPTFHPYSHPRNGPSPNFPDLDLSAVVLIESARAGYVLTPHILTRKGVKCKRRAHSFWTGDPFLSHFDQREPVSHDGQIILRGIAFRWP
jgi:hypothetical protein